jgi:hypothetical protein
MGKYLFDKYTYLHFAMGIVSYYWNISFTWMLILHTIFEILENTETGVFIIHNYITYWPGGKDKADTIINRVGDTIGAIIGWISAYYVSK